MADKPVDTVFLHCKKCFTDKTHQSLDVLLIDGELLVIACSQHTPPAHVCSVKVDPARIILTQLELDA